MGPGAGLNVLEKRKICCPFRGSSVLLTRYKTPEDLNFVIDVRNSNFTLTGINFDTDVFCIPDVMV
jgi:hypothetical protein